MNRSAYDNQWYDKAVKRIRDSRFVFMNHGYAKLKVKESFRWLQREDSSQKYSMNLIRELLRSVDIKGKVVLDAGCGRGGACSYMVRHLKPHYVYGLDSCHGNILFCQRTHCLERLEFIHGAAEAMPFRDGFCDVVLNVESSHCYRDVSVFFREVCRVLKAGGLFCYADGMSSEGAVQRREVLVDCGLHVQKEADMTSNIAAAIRLGSKHMKAFFCDMIQKGTADSDFIGDLYSKITGPIYQNYLSGRVVYKVWVLRK